MTNTITDNTDYKLSNLYSRIKEGKINVRNRTKGEWHEQMAHDRLDSEYRELVTLITAREQQARLDEVEIHKHANLLAKATKDPSGTDVIIHDQLDRVFSNRIKALSNTKQMNKENES